MVTRSTDYSKHVYFTCQIQIVNVRTFSTGISLTEKNKGKMNEYICVVSAYIVSK
jgi:hypothetical protein